MPGIYQDNKKTKASAVKTPFNPQTSLLPHLKPGSLQQNLFSDINEDFSSYLASTTFLPEDLKRLSKCLGFNSWGF
jgi:hypothetical protein